MLVNKSLELIETRMRVKGMPVGQIVKGGFAGKRHWFEIGNGRPESSSITVVQTEKEWAVCSDGC